MGVELLAALFGFIFVSALVIYIFTRVPSARLVEQRLGAMGPSSATQTMESEGLLRRNTGTFPVLRRLLANSSWADSSAISLQQAGLALKVSEYVLIRLSFAAFAAVIVLLLLGLTPLGVILAAIVSSVASLLPAWYLSNRRGRRIQTINAQLVETLQLISNALRSGFAFTQAVEMAAKQVQSPMQDELNRFLQDSALGARTDAALDSLVERTGSYDIEMMVTTITVQRTTGGNLSEILDNVAETIRERERLQGEIRALTASQRLTGLILSIYPIFLGLAFTLIAPSLMKVLWQEEAGRVLLGIAAVLQVVGIVIIRRILTLDV